MKNKILWILTLGCLIACHEPAENSENDAIEDTIELKNENAERNRQLDSSKVVKKKERPSIKQMSIHKEGMEETITANLYTSPNNFPLAFHTYVPNGIDVENFDTGEGKIVNFKRNEANFKLIVLPKSIESRVGAMQIAKNYVENEGEAKEIENGFQLTSSKTSALTTEVGERNGYFYIWLSHYPLEYGDGFGPESHFIKQNLKWN